MTRWFRWLWMLSKRLYKRASFLVILALIPLAVAALQIAARADSGFIHVVLAQTDPSDPVSSALVEEFMAEDSLVRFSYAPDPRTATDRVIGGEADAAWIFSDDMQGRLESFVDSHYRRGGFVTVVEREQTVFTRITREKLAFALQTYTSRVCYLDFTRDNIEGLNALTDEELMAYFNGAEFSDELFLFRSADGEVTQPRSDYLTAPVRGLLGILTVLCGLAAALFYCQDRARGTFALVPERRHGIVAFACLLVAVLNVSAVVYGALLVAGVAAFWLKELAVVLLYSLCCAAFCLLVLRVFGSVRALAAVLPVLVVAMLTLCPVFFDFRPLLAIQMLFPPTYFVNAGYDDRWMVYMLLYATVCTAVALIPEWIAHGRGKKRSTEV